MTNTNYYLSTEMRMGQRGEIHLRITRITKTPFEGRDFKVSIDTEEGHPRTGGGGIWDRVCRELTRMHDEHPNAIHVFTSTKLGARHHYNREYRAHQSPAGFYRPNRTN